MCQRLSFQDFTARLRQFFGRSCLVSLAAADAVEFEALALELFALQFEHNRAYQQLCRMRGITRPNVDHWTRIPAVPTAAFKELDLTCLPPDAVIRTFRSSGTTKQSRSRHLHSADSLAIYEASLLPWFQANLLQGGQGTGMALLILSPLATDCPDSSLAHMFDTVRRGLEWEAVKCVGRINHDGAWALDLEQAIGALHQAQANAQPVLLLGTAFLFVHLVDELERRKAAVRLPPGSRVFETGGYKGQSRVMSQTELHANISNALGVYPHAIITEYAMSEISSQAYDCRYEQRVPTAATNRRFSFPPWARAQIISPETGQPVDEGDTGLVRIVDLANVFSVMAIQIEDLAVRRRDGFQLIGRAPQAEPRGCSLLSISNESA